MRGAASGHKFDVAQVASTALIEPRRTQRILDELVDLGVVHVEEVKGRNRYTMRIAVPTG